MALVGLLEKPHQTLTRAVPAPCKRPPTLPRYRKEGIQVRRIHGLLIAVVLGAAAVAGTSAMLQTVSLGADAKSASDKEIAKADMRLDREESGRGRISRHLHDRVRPPACGWPTLRHDLTPCGRAGRLNSLGRVYSGASGIRPPERKRGLNGLFQAFSG